MPGMGGGGPTAGAFDPTSVKVRGLKKKLDPLKKERETTDKGILRTMVSQKIDKPRMLRVLPRAQDRDVAGPVNSHEAPIPWDVPWNHKL